MKKKESQLQRQDQIPAVLLEPLRIRLYNVSLEGLDVIFSIDNVPELMRNANIRQSTRRFLVIHSFICSQWNAVW